MDTRGARFAIIKLMGASRGISPAGTTLVVLTILKRFIFKVGISNHMRSLFVGGRLSKSAFLWVGKMICYDFSY